MPSINELRKKIDDVDIRLLETLEQRQELVRQIQTIKEQKSMPVRDPAREADILKHLQEHTTLEPDLIKQVYEAIFSHAK